MNVIATFEIAYYQYLNEASLLVETLPSDLKNPHELQKIYRLMVLLRTFDSKAIALQRTGKLGTYPSTRGQEATFVGIGAALQKSDVFVPYYRDVGVLMQRGVKLSDILLYWGGDERGNYSSMAEDFPYSVPVGSQPLHAVGIATAIKIRKQKRAVLTVCGEGASSQGDFYEAMNVAGVWKLPVVFVVSNNQWAISVPRSAQSASQTIAQKAIAAGLQGEQVDGNDVIAVYERVSQALKRARETNEATLLEIITYRQSDHTTADDASRYEPQGVREEEWKKEPIERLKKYLMNTNAWTEEQEHALHKECASDVEKIVHEYINAVPQAPESMFDHLYETLPDIYAEQREHVSHKEAVAHG
ncbi:MAG: pyruvate dehydrogenase (acetyl-transferring) E1 component subunit alpha [Gammaproteobacteria bacterium]|nr:pyruvate dehydrogenase (acetyl-transferring) E1 component subunit alpha [Gammaproteobacteria bacterium]